VDTEQGKTTRQSKQQTDGKGRLGAVLAKRRGHVESPKGGKKDAIGGGGNSQGGKHYHHSKKIKVMK